MINSRNIADLLPVVARKCVDFIQACKAQGIDVLITSTYRDVEAQNALYAEGRTVKGDGVSLLRPMGRAVTNARGGESFHNYSCAFDFVPVVNGKPRWSDTALITRCGVIAESVGLEWAGRWTTMREMLHCQWTGGLTLADLKAGKRPAVPLAVVPHG